MLRISENYKVSEPTPGNFESIDNESLHVDTDTYKDVLGSSSIMQEIYRKICLVAPTNATVLIVGESGTGKEIAARLIHDLSRRSNEVFLAINCGALSPQLVESELFGHKKGSFTGANRDHKGFFESAHGGTLFLDEIAEMSLELQVKLLRVLEMQQVMRIGSGREIATDVRIVAATNRPPLGAVKEGKLREDLFYRLQVFPIEIPRLFERVEDIELLANRFLDKLNSCFNSKIVFDPSAIEAMKKYDWPGNVRELKNAVHRAFIMSEGVISDAYLPRASKNEAHTRCTLSLPVGCSLAEMEKSFILATLKNYNGDKERTASVLGICLKTLYNKLNQYIQPNTKEVEY